MHHALLTVSPFQVMGLWEELMQCVYGDNRYGSTVAEIYLYTLMPRTPSIEFDRNSERSLEACEEACKCLFLLCKLFEERNEVKLYLFEGEADAPLDLDHLLPTRDRVWVHRVHIGVLNEQNTQDERRLSSVEES